MSGTSLARADSVEGKVWELVLAIRPIDRQVTHLLLPDFYRCEMRQKQ